jgi:hypothetical protein
LVAVIFVPVVVIAVPVFGSIPTLPGLMYPVTPPSAPANKASLGFILPVVIPCTSKFAAPALIAPAKKALVVKDAPSPAPPKKPPAGPNNIPAPTVSAILPIGDLATDLTALATPLTTPETALPIL